MKLIDLERIVPPDSDYLYDSVHFNDFGSKFVSKVINESLQDVINQVK